MKLSRILPLVVGSAAAGILASSAPAQALVFNAGGTDYDVTTITGTYNQLSTQLQSSPWWGNSTLAQQLASAAGSSLGLPNGGFGPAFAYSSSGFDGGVEIYAFAQVNGTFPGGLVSPINWNENIGWSVQATPVPFDISGGATIPTVVSLFALALMRKAKKSMALKNRMANPVTTTVS